MDYLVALACSLLLFTSTSRADEGTCLKTGKNCTAVDIDHPRAERALRRGCEAKDAHACTRLGQFYEVKRMDLRKAVPAYEKACEGKEDDGCKAASVARMDLCYVQKRKSFCAKVEPTGEFRVIAFLENFDPKYADAFATRNFGNPWAVKRAKELYEQRLKEKHPKLLKALEAEQASKRHDGSDAESLNHDIACLKGNCLNDNFGE